METEIIAMYAFSIIHMFVGFALAPLMIGIVNRTKAVFAGRTGQPFLQPYYDMVKLLRKGAVYSRTTSWIFRAAPVVGLACAVAALAIVPFGNAPGLLSFEGDLVFFAYVLGLWRFFLVIAALDTGSAFEGMGASREVQFSAMAEPVLFVGLATVATLTGSLSLSDMIAGLSLPLAEIVLVAAALFVVFLCENARIPFDDPNTHLELTMIHEVMVLDHSGPDFAFITYAASLKLWLLGSLIVGLTVPVADQPVIVNLGLAAGGLLLLSVFTGAVESIMARLRLVRVPQLLVAAGALSLIAFMFAMG